MGWCVLDVLGADERHSLLERARRHRFRRGEILFHEGQGGDTLHLLERGHVAVKRTLPTGDVGTLLVLGPGDAFGELAVVAPAPRNATITAIGAVETLGITGAAFDDVRARFPAVDRVLIHALAAEVRRLSAMLMEALYVPAETRILLRLVELADLFAEGRRGPVVIPLTQAELACMAGTARPTVNRVLRGAEDSGDVEMGRGRIVVHNGAALRERVAALGGRPRELAPAATR